MINVKKSSINDVNELSDICLSAFKHSVAPNTSEQGIQTFEGIASVEAFQKRITQDNVILLAYLDLSPVGVLELKEGRHLAMLFVRPDCQQHGVGRALIENALDYVSVDRLTVRASLNSVPAYTQYGFEVTGAVGEVSGLVYQPMEMLCTHLTKA